MEDRSTPRLLPGSQRILETVLEQAIQLTGAERAFLLLGADEGFECVVSRTAPGIDHDDRQFSRSVVQDVLSSRRGRVLLDALQEETYSYSESIRRLEIRSIMAAPLQYEDRLLGVLYLDSRVATGIFKEPELEILEAFAAVASATVHSITAG